jgi:raffinose/stachyose/melibiose transport system permease protein/N-acetylglucosamine transport system permease protein
LEEKPKRRKNIYKTPTVLWVVSAIFMIYSIGLLYPLFFALNSALKKDDPTFIMHMAELTKEPRSYNFIRAFTELEISGVGFFDMFANSMWFAGGTMLFNVMSSAFLAYGVAKYRFKGRDKLYAFVLIIMIFPAFGTLPARYKLYSKLGFIDSPLLLLAYAGAFDGQFLILYAFFKNVDWSYAESAFLDGAGHWKVFLKIMFPMSLPAVAALCVTNFIGSWNNYSDVLLYLPNTPTLATGLHVYNTKMMYQADRPLLYAGMIVSLIPVMLVYFTLRKTLMQMTFEGGIKG